MKTDELEAIQARVNEAEAKRARSRKNPDPIFDAGMMLAIQASSADVPALLSLVRVQAAKLDAVEEWCETNQHPTTDYPEGFSSQDYALDDAARRIRAAITDIEATK